MLVSSSVPLVLSLLFSLVSAGGKERQKPVPGKIQNVIMIMMENRAFDTLFGYLDHNPDIDNLVGKAPICNYVNQNDTTSAQVCTSNLQVDGSNFGPDHEYFHVNNEVYGTYFPTEEMISTTTPPMNGFVNQALSNTGGDMQAAREVMAGYDPKNIPIHATLAREFTIVDRYFASIPGPTQPNRIFSHCATSGGWFDNNKYNLALGNGCRPIQKDIADAGLSWKTYFQEVPSFFFVRDTRLDMAFHTRLYSEFLEDLKKGHLANYTYLEETYGTLPNNNVNANDGHASGTHFHNAELLLKELYEAVRASPQWESTLLMITYDEHGGFHDHVPPPLAPNPDGITTVDPESKYTYAFDRLGLRVPMILVSPWVAKGAVEHEPKGPYASSQYEHSSIAATLRDIFHLPSPPLTKREAWAGSFGGIFLDEMRTDCLEFLPAVNMTGF